MHLSRSELSVRCTAPARGAGTPWVRPARHHKHVDLRHARLHALQRALLAVRMQLIVSGVIVGQVSSATWTRHPMQRIAFPILSWPAVAAMRCGAEPPRGCDALGNIGTTLPDKIGAFHPSPLKVVPTPPSGSDLEYRGHPRELGGARGQHVLERVCHSRLSSTGIHGDSLVLYTSDRGEA